MVNGTMARKGYVLIYTRAPVEGEYSGHLAYSAHFAYSSDGKNFQALNRNYGILYASATIGQNNTIIEKGLKRPFLFRTAEGKFGVAAVRINADGSDDEESKGKILLWTSDDLHHFNEIGPADLRKDADMGGVSFAEPGAEYSCDPYVTGPEGAVCGNILQVDGTFGDQLVLKWTPLENISVKVPDRMYASKADELNEVPATALYSDGSTAVKQVLWDTGNIDFTKPGTYQISGTVVQDEYRFPLAPGYADPDVLHWNGKCYFIATNDNTNDVGLYVREADSVPGLFEKGVREYVILDKNEEKGYVQTFWAPEFHMVGGELYIFFAVGGKKWGPQSHVMKLKKGGGIIDPDGWEEPVRVRKMDGDYLTDDGITLDMTYFEANKKSYVIWSYRIWKTSISSMDDSGSMLLIATVNPAEPWQLASEPVQLSRPLYGWENNERTINNEGPYAIVTDDHVFVTYSGGAAGGYTYVLGLLSASKHDNLLDPKNWIKSSAPVLSYYSVKDEYGPGHNTFYMDESGNLMIAYHAQESLKSNLRCTGIRRVHFNIDGIPVFDMSAGQDLNPKLARVTTKVRVG